MSVANELTKMMNDFTREQTRTVLKDVGKKYQPKFKSTVNSIVDDWFGEYSSLSMKTAMTVDSPKVKIFKDGSGGELRLRLWVNIDKYNPKDKANKWAAKYNGDLSGEMYVLQNELDKGILALPKMAKHRSDSNWINKYYDEQNSGREPLWETILEHSKLQSLFDEIENEINGINT